MTHSYMRHVSFVCVTWLIHMCDMTHTCVWHDSFMYVTWLIHMFGKYFASHSFSSNETSYMTRPFHICNMTYSCVWHISFICDMPHLNVWHDLFICVTWLIRFYDVTICVIGLIHVCDRLIHMCDMTHSWCIQAPSLKIHIHIYSYTYVGKKTARPNYAAQAEAILEAVNEASRLLILSSFLFPSIFGCMFWVRGNFSDFACMNVFKDAHKHTFSNTRTCRRTCMYTCIYVYIHAHAYARTHACIYI